MLIKNRRGWELPDSAATPEALFFDRRALLKGAGMAAFAGALAACNKAPAPAAATAPAAPVTDPSASLYPFMHNPKYTLDRPITPANVVGSYNNYYEFGDNHEDASHFANMLQIRPWEISFEGMVEKPFKMDIDTLMKAMPLEERLYRHRCVETWAYAVPWSGFAMKALVDLAKPMSGATYVKMITFQNPAQAPGQQDSPFLPWPYTEGLTIAEATNEMAFMVTGAYGKPLLNQNGAPLRLATPWKYGFKSTKGIQRIVFTDQRPKTYWQELTPSEYGFWANINPEVPHPRWSQASEWLLDENAFLGEGARVPTKLYNGYAEQVASLYTNIKGEQLFR